MLLAVAFGCRPRKVDECATVQARVLEELRVADSLHDGLQDEAAIARNTQRLQALSAELRALEIQDTGLRQAVERYRASIDSLAGAFARLAPPPHAAAGDAGFGPGTADAGAALPDAGGAEGGPAALGALLSTHAAAVNGARSAISRACGTR